MKLIRQDNQGNFICEECEQSFKYKKGLAKHINCNHDSIKFYYDKYSLNDEYKNHNLFMILKQNKENIDKQVEGNEKHESASTKK
jgi:uncharacterized C2H2 Zn-finger protein